MGRGIDTVTLKAAHILPSPGEVIEGGRVVIQGSKITGVGSLNTCRAEGEEIDFGDTAIIPGLVNAHTHLELTDLEGRIPPPSSFSHWLRYMVAYRRDESNKDLSHAVERGVRLSLEAGTTTVADISTTNDSFKVLPGLPIRKRVFKEIMALDPRGVAPVLEGAIRILSGFPRDNIGGVGLSPHAPYTACEKLYKGCALFSQGQDMLLTTHISETEEELEFLSRGTGGLATLLRAAGMLDNWKPPGLTPVAFLKKTGALERSWLLAHCNYPRDEEVQLIKESGSSVVYCPRSHNYFGHRAHPFPRLLKEGINVALGTDSLASNKSLSILDEMRFAAANYGDVVGPQTVMMMATEGGARALGMEDRIGRISPGFEADLAVIELPGDGGGAVVERLFLPESQNVFTMVAGRPCYDRYGLFEG